jgi:hypothetical protein
VPTATFNSSGTWTAPSNLTGTVIVKVWGPGVDGHTAGLLGGAGGGGGAFSQLNAFAATPSSSYTVTVGTRQSYVTAGTSDSWFDATSTCLAQGASAGTGGHSGSGVGDVVYSGGNGGAAGGGSAGAGGGSSAGTGSNGNNGTASSGATPGVGGAAPTGGGAGGDGSPPSGNASSAPGGGGGGAAVSGSTGAAKDGRVEITYDVLEHVTEAASAADSPDAVVVYPVSVSEAGSAASTQDSVGILVAEVDEFVFALDFTDIWNIYDVSVTEAASAADFPGINNVLNQLGLYGVYGPNMRSRAGLGNYRIANSIFGYNVYVGVNALPDLTAGPAQFSAVLPIYVTTTPPVSGTKTYYVLVRAQDHYGLESQNSNYYTLTIDSSGNPFLPPVNGPVDLHAFPAPGQAIRVLALYPGYGVDAAPADQWKVWINTVPPNPAVDPPTSIISITGVSLNSSLATYTPNLYYVTVGLYRVADGTLSSTLTTTVVIPPIPVQVVPVRGGKNPEQP